MFPGDLLLGRFRRYYRPIKYGNFITTLIKPSCIYGDVMLAQQSYSLEQTQLQINQWRIKINKFNNLLINWF
jgi:hypothetical protein